MALHALPGPDDHDPIFSHYERIARELQKMSALIRAARDKPSHLRAAPPSLAPSVTEEDAKIYAKRS
jgi:hypothetical protein